MASHLQKTLNFSDFGEPSLPSPLIRAVKMSHLRVRGCSKLLTLNLTGLTSFATRTHPHTHQPRARTAVDIFNATLLIIRLEENHFEKYKALAWVRTEHLTPRGILIMENAFKDVGIRSFEVDIRQDGNCHCCTVP